MISFLNVTNKLYKSIIKINVHKMTTIIFCVIKNKKSYKKGELFFYFRSDYGPDPYQNETDPKHWYKAIKIEI